MKRACLEYSVQQFKDKSNELCQLFTQESMKLLNQYQFIRKDNMDKDNSLKEATAIL